METSLEQKSQTVEEYGSLPNDGRLTELVRGKVVEIKRPFTSHGYFTNRIATLLGQFVDEHEFGRVVCGGAGTVTQRKPDTVRGLDVAYYSFERIPRGPLPKGYWPAGPELVVEIRSEDDRWKDILQKVGEYLGANVLTVAVVDPESQHVHLYSADRETVILKTDDQLTFPDLLPGYEMIVGKLFE